MKNPKLKFFVIFLDEKEKYDPTGFRDAVIAGLEGKTGDLEAISKFLDTAGNKLDYRRYGEVLFDILIAGGLLVPGEFANKEDFLSSLKRLKPHCLLITHVVFFPRCRRLNLARWRKAVHKCMHFCSI